MNAPATSWKDKPLNWYVRYRGRSSIPLRELLKHTPEWISAIADVVRDLQGYGSRFEGAIGLAADGKSLNVVTADTPPFQPTILKDRGDLGVD